MRKKANLPEITHSLITGMSHDGRGITILEDGKTTFVNGALSGETVSFKLTKKHPRYNEGEVTHVLLPSPDRAIPACKHFGVCGGCNMQHLNTRAQIQLKQKVLLEQLRHFGQVEPEHVMTPISAQQLGYRRKARLGVRYVEKKQKLLIGFREKSSRYLADIEVCPVLHTSVGERLPLLANVIASLTQFQQIPQIEVAVGDKVTALVIRHLADLPEDDLQKLKAFAEQENIHLYLQPNSGIIAKLWPDDMTHRLHYTLADYQLEMQFHPLDFTQVNGETNPLMIAKALELLAVKNNENVLDLFCGLGNFTLPIAKFANHVVGVEGSEAMVSRAQDNAAANHIQNCEFYASNLADLSSANSNWINKTYNKILLDPPRTGAKEIVEEISRFKAQRIVYVSCNPATLARDAGILVHKHGYRLRDVGVINMFPHTGHVEAIALFESA